ncbi:acyltransferase family protein [Maricaulis sp. CAU 1757]
MKAAHPILHEVQHLRALAVLLVVLAHLHQGEARFFPDAVLGDFAYVGFAGVDIFFVISGFIIHHLYRHRRTLSGRFFLDRANRIFPLYWIFTGLALVGYAVMADELRADPGDIDLAGSLLLFPLGHPPILQVGWTLTHELWFYGVYGLALALPRAGRAGLALLWGGLSLAVLVSGWQAPNAWLAVAVSPFNLQFLAGVLLAEFEPQARARRWLPLVMAGAGAGLALAWTADGGLTTLAAAGARVAVFTPLAVGVVWSFLAWRPALWRTVERIGDASYAIYLSHLLVIGVLARMLPQLVPVPALLSALYWPLGLGACLIVGVLTHYLLERPLLVAGKALIARGLR